MRNKKQTRLYAYGLILIAAFLFTAYYAFWREGATKMRGSVEDWIEDQRAAGLTIDYTDIRSAGFPSRLRSSVDNFQISDTGDESGAWRWRAGHLDIDVLPIATNRLTFSVRGMQELYVDGVGAWRVESSVHKFVLTNNDDRSWTAQLESGPGKLIALNGVGEAAAQQVSVNASPGAAGHNQLKLALAIAGGTINLTSAPIDIPVLEADISISQTPPLADGDSWRAAGGFLRFDRVYIETEGASATFSGALTLDENGYPQGTLDAEITRPAGIGRLLEKAGLLQAGEAQAIEAALALIAVAGGGKISAPIILEDGVATLAGIKLVDLPRVFQIPQP